MKPDLMILDLLMPSMHGFDVCQVLRLDESLSDMKILIASAKSFELDKGAANRLGAKGYICKPLSDGELLEAVRGLLGDPLASSDDESQK